MHDKHRRATGGQAKVEYILLIGLVTAVVIGALILAGPHIGGMFKSVGEELESITPTAITLTPTPTPTPVLPTKPAPTPAPETDTRLSYSDFEDGDALEWYEARGHKWGVEDGEYCASSGGEHRSFSGDEDWTDYEAELQADLSKGNGFGVYFRATNPDAVNAYCFQYDPGYGKGAFLFRKVVNGRERSPSVVERPPKDYAWHSGPRDIRLRVVGNTYTAFVDGEQVAQLVDDSYPHGAVGLRTWDGSRTCFDDVTVTSIE